MYNMNEENIEADQKPLCDMCERTLTAPFRVVVYKMDGTESTVDNTIFYESGLLPVYKHRDCTLQSQRYYRERPEMIELMAKLKTEALLRNGRTNN